jgi:hypothetical protein
MKLSALCLAFPLLAASALTACDTETGANGLVDFTPHECGNAANCDLDNGVAVGGTVWVELDGIDDVDLDGATLSSADPNVFEVIGYRPGTWPEFEIIGNNPGYADMIVFDRDGYEMDYLSVAVRDVGRVDVESRDGAAVGPLAEPGFDAVWEVNAGQRVAFDAVAADDLNGSPIGEIDYLVEVDEVLLANMESTDELAHGRLRFTVGAGEYPVTFTAPSGAYTRVLIRAR